MYAIEDLKKKNKKNLINLNKSIELNIFKINKIIFFSFILILKKIKIIKITLD
jgi:hypothetical protein